MLYFTRYALHKFDVLNKHNVFITREQVEDVLRLPDTVEQKGKYGIATKDGIGVVYRAEGDTKHVITFYPIKLKNNKNQKTNNKQTQNYKL